MGIRIFKLGCQRPVEIRLIVTLKDIYWSGTVFRNNSGTKY